jgi:hypothetical protein
MKWRAQPDQKKPLFETNAQKKHICPLFLLAQTKNKD